MSVGLIQPGDFLVEIDGVDVTNLTVSQITQKLRGPPLSSVRLVKLGNEFSTTRILYPLLSIVMSLQLIDRGERFPIVFSHTKPDAAFKAPKEAFYVQARLLA